MTLAVTPPVRQTPLSFEEFLGLYGDDNRYKLIDGEVFDLDPTGPHEKECKARKRMTSGSLQLE